jgi:hypothetical protein
VALHIMRQKIIAASSDELGVVLYSAVGEGARVRVRAGRCRLPAAELRAGAIEGGCYSCGGCRPLVCPSLAMHLACHALPAALSRPAFL